MPHEKCQPKTGWKYFQYTAIAFAVLSTLNSVSHAQTVITGNTNQPENSALPPSWTVDGSLIIGGNGSYGGKSGSLTITDGNQVNNSLGIIGFSEDNIGTVNVSGSGSQWNNSNGLIIGNRGSGILHILDGAAVTTSDPTRDLEIGAFVGSTGQVLVSGAGSHLHSNNVTYVGIGGYGRLDISDGASMTSRWTMYVGHNQGTTGDLTVTGNKTTLDTWTLRIGENGNGFASITDGAKVNSGWFFLGTNAGSHGELLVSGADTKLILHQSHATSVVGLNGSAKLTIADGALVETGEFLSVGSDTGAEGHLIVTDKGTTLNVNQGIFVGTSGTGLMEVKNGATVNTNYFFNLATGPVSGEGYGELILQGNATLNTPGVFIGFNDSTGVLNIGSAVGEIASSAGKLNAAYGYVTDYEQNNFVTLSDKGKINFNHTNTDYQFDADIFGEGSVAFYNGTTVLNGNNNYSGITSILGGEVRAGNGESFSASSDYDVGQAGVMDLAGYSQSLASLRLAGTVNFNGAPGTVLTVKGDYLGDNGQLIFNSALGDDTSATDKLVVRGDTSGTTRVSVNNVGGQGAATLNGIELIQVNGLSDGEFVQNGRIVAGAHDYSLVRGMTNANNWYLTSSALPGAPGPSPEPAPSETPALTPEPGPSETPRPTPEPMPEGAPMIERPEASGYSTNLAAANTLFVTRLHDRLGETQYIDSLTGEKSVSSLWLRNEGGHNRSRDAQDQLSTQANRYVMQLGGDIAQWSTNDSDRFHLGVMAGYANSKSRTESRLSGYRARASVSGYSTGLYGTWYASEADKTGLYVDGWAQYSWFDNTIDGQDLNTEKYKSKGFTTSLESGYTYKVGESASKNTSYFVQPKAQVTWMGVKADDHQEANGTKVSGEGDGNIQTRLGVKAFIDIKQDKSQARGFQPFVEANWIHNSKDFGAKLDTVSVKQDGAANIGELKLGVEGQINKNLNLWGNVGQQVGNKGYSDTGVMLGVKYNF